MKTYQERLKELRDAIVSLTSHPQFKDENEVFQERLEDLEFELDLTIKETE